jgi:threonine/homoserine/homoserine lactone efflux protein
MIPFLTAGIILGFSAGIAPGPLLALVIAETLQHHLKAGIKVAFAPIITDLPIVFVTISVLARLSDFKAVLGLISICGGFFISYLGFQCIRTSGITISGEGMREASLKKGIIANFLSPHPYLFWLSVGAPMTIRAMDQTVFAAAAFIGSFYILLVGSKVAIAVMVSRSRSFLAGKAYIFTMRMLGLILVILAGFLFYDGILMITAF